MLVGRIWPTRLQKIMLNNCHNTDITIRKLTPPDASAYREIRLESLRLHPEKFEAKYEEEVLKQKLVFEQAVENEDPKRFVVGAFDGGKLIGIFSSILSNAYGLENTATLIQMYLRGVYRGMGIGDRLTTQATALSLASGVDNVILEVKSNNSRALRLYKKAGFVLVDRSVLSSKPESNSQVMSFCKRK